MTRLRSVCFLCAFISIGTTVFAEPIPQPSSKKSEVVEKNKSSTRHDHSNGGNADCQYIKGTWSECSSTTNAKTRTLTLKKGQDEIKCEKFKTVEKKCKKSKGCKYDKGTWSKCNESNEMTRVDVLRNPNERDASCEKSKLITKTCKSKTDRNNKGQQKRKHKQQETTNTKNKKN